MGSVAAAALPGGKRHVQTELAKFFHHGRMTGETDLAVRFGQEPFFLGGMGQMAGQTLPLGCRGMTKGTLSI